MSSLGLNKSQIAQSIGCSRTTVIQVLNIAEENCEQCSASNEVPYQLTQFKKHYRDYAVKINATMHPKHKPGEILQVDWAGQTAEIVDTDTGELIPANIFVATLPYSCYAYVEAFLSMNQEWTARKIHTTSQIAYRTCNCPWKRDLQYPWSARKDRRSHTR